MHGWPEIVRAMLTLPLAVLRCHLYYYRWYSPEHARAHFPARFMHRMRHPKNQPKGPAK